VNQTNLSKKLLVVEDEHIIRSICSRVLTKEGFNVVLASDGNMAVELLDNQEFDICLLDIRTPGIDGLDLYKYIYMSFPDLSSRVIFMTGDSLSKKIADFVADAGSTLLEKPFTTNELVQAVKRV